MANMMRPIREIAIIGTGVIGASWSALFLAKGLDVVATDVAPDAETSLRRFVEAAWPALKRLGLASGASQSRLSFTPDLPSALRSADFVQENGQERIDFKTKLYRRLDELLAADVIIASSSSGLTMSAIQADCPLHPERCVIGHPFNPPHLVPLVEIVGGAKTSAATIQRADEFYDGLGKQTVRLRKEVPGHVANRLQAALAREVYSLVAEGVVSVADVDKALCWGPGLRWGIMGQVMLNHLGGGQGGIEHFFQQFTGPLTAWWKTLGAPELTPAVQGKLAAGLHEEVGARSIAELEAQRDEVLLGLLELRKKVEGSVAPRTMVGRRKNLSVMLGEVISIDLRARTVAVNCPDLGVRQTPFDFLVIATGMRPSYFGHDECARYAPGLNTHSDAEPIRATWLVWVFLHLMSLPQMQNRLRVQRQWLWSYFTGQRSSRLIPESSPATRAPRGRMDLAS